LLRGKLTLHDVRDAEGLCARILERANLEQSYHDREDLLAFLIETAWELSLEFNADGGRNPSFSSYVTKVLRVRLIDWQRAGGKRTRWQFSDRTYERQLPEFVPFDASEGGIEFGVSMDVDADRFSTVLGIHRGRDSRRIGRDAALGEEAVRRVA